MDQIEQYKTVMSEIIAKQAVILGPTMAVARARKVAEITVSEDGKVTSVTGEPSAILEKLIATYVELSGEIVKNALGPIFLKYPSVKPSN